VKKGTKILMKNYEKTGISLIVLIITIIVALILIATAVISTTNAIDDTNITTFMDSLTEVQEATESYYIANNVMPMIDGSEVMNKDGLISISRSSEKLLEELTENSDLDSQFYKLDLAKLNVTKTPYGYKKSGENDIFVIAYPSMNVYYPYGVNARSTIYFSITSKISNVTKIPQDQVDNSITTVISSGGVKVTKYNGWANKMGVNIEAEMAVDETLYISVSGGTKHQIITTIGTNKFGFDLLSSLTNDTETMKLSDELSTEEIAYIESGTKPLAERYVDILKYKGTEIIGKVRIDLSNFSKSLPTITNATLSSYETMNMVKLSLASSESGIKEIRYEYLKKYTDNGTIEDYYEGISDFDSAYMLSKAKSSKLVSGLTTTINAPKNIQSIKIAIIDKAGNINLYNQEIAPRLYIGYSIDSSTQESVQLTAKMFSINGIKSITFSKSLDGKVYTDEQVYALNTTTNGTTYKQNSPYTNITADNVYIKMVAVNYDSTITETRIVKISLNYMKSNASGIESNPGVPLTENSTINGRAPSYNNPVIPAGFVAINTYDANWNNLSTDWDKGLVIQDLNANQFVWVPVDGTNVTYAKWCTSGISYASTTDDTLPSGFDVNKIISTYKGFYIARYESMFDYNYGNIRVASKKSANKTTTSWTRDSSHTGYLWNFVNYTDAKTYSENMAATYGYDTTKVGTNLITGAQWDTTLKWIQNSGVNVIDNRLWGNFSNSLSPANLSGFGSLQISGYSDYWKAKNIYDLAGNAWEWTSEKSSSNIMSRSGHYSIDGSTYSAAYRELSTATDSYNFITFRLALYIK
jgi:Tfp pilus assembly protein PilE